MQAPLHTPKHLVGEINTAIVKALKDPELQERLFNVGAQAAGTSAAEFGTFLREETDRWGKVLRTGGTIPALAK